MTKGILGKSYLENDVFFALATKQEEMLGLFIVDAGSSHFDLMSLAKLEGEVFIVAVTSGEFDFFNN